LNQIKKIIKLSGIIIVVLIVLLVSFIPLFPDGTSIVKADHQFSSTYTIPFEQPTFSTVQMNNDTNYLEVFVPDTMMSAETGDALLPVYAAHILIPEGCIITDINIEERRFTDYSTVLDDAILMPAQEEVPFSEMKQASDSSYQLKRNQSWYDQTDFQPTTSFQSLGISHMKGYPIKTIHLFPLRYHPSEQLLWFYAELQLTVTFSYEQEPLSSSTMSSRSSTSRMPSASANQFYRGKSADLEKVKDLVVNHEMLHSFPLRPDTLDDSSDGPVPLGGGSSEESGSAPLGESYPGGLCDPVDTYQYVIITSEALADDTSYPYSWADLLAHRQQQDGLTGTIVTVEDIYECEDYWNTTERFNDSAAQVREFIKDAYLDWGTEYVLLGGSWQEEGTYKWDERQIVPARIMTDRKCSDSIDQMASDLYFSNLDGDWWYSDSGGMWGGGQGSGVNDKFSELAVGRVPVWTAEHVSNFIHKVLWYDNYDDVDWLRSAAFLGAYLGWSSTSKQYMEEIRIGDGSFSQYAGFEEWNDERPIYELDTSHRYYEADYPGDAGSDRQAAAVADWTDAFNNNLFSIVSYLGHGSSLNTFNLLDGRNLDSDTYFFLGTSQACLNGRFTNGDSSATTFTSKWDDRGGYAMVLNSGYGYGSSSSTAGMSQHQHKIWWDYFFNEESNDLNKWRLGLAMQYTKDTFSSVIDSGSWANCYVWYSWNLFGDPAQHLRITTGENSAPTISSPDPADTDSDVSIDLNQLSFSITDTDGDLLNWTIETSPDIGSSSGNNEGNGTKTCSIAGVAYDTVYMWFVNASDGSEWMNESFTFSTGSDPSNRDPVISNPIPSNQSSNVDITIDQVSVTITDPDEDEFSYSIEGFYLVDSSNGGEFNGTKTADVISPLPFDTMITWFVNASDGLNSSQASFVFSTRLPYDPSPPSELSSEAVNRTSIRLNWTKNLTTEITRIERNVVSSWDLGDGTLVYNDSGNTITDIGLLPGVMYYYQAWSWNDTDARYGSEFSTTNAVTHSNTAVSISNPSPSNNSFNCSTDLIWSADISDADGDTFDWHISCGNGQNNSVSGASNGTKQIELQNLDHDTLYTLWVNVTDGFHLTKAWYQFTTESVVDEEAPVITSVLTTTSDPIDTDPSFGWMNLSCMVDDNDEVSLVSVNMTFPDLSWINESLTQFSGTDSWFFNMSLSMVGNYSMILYVIDLQGNMNQSSLEFFSLAPNWDITLDGQCGLLDLNAISNNYGLEGPLGWIREDVNNDGKISVLDLVVVSEHYGEIWWD
jgi:hypothetical protein